MRVPEARKRKILWGTIAVVVALLVMVPTFSFWLQSSASQDYRQDKTEALLAAISTALEGYRAENADYVRGSHTELLQELAGLSSPEASDFLKGVPRSMVVGGQLVDAWGDPIQYRYPGEHNGGGFDLWSMGGKPETASAWITNWD